MKERPILFSGPMVRAILEGRKTQTRRVVKNCKQFAREGVAGPDDAYDAMMSEDRSHARFLVGGDMGYTDSVFCPYGQPGDRLWVRETFASDGIMAWHKADCDNGPPSDTCQYPDGSMVPMHRWTPSVYMPRWASRITLEIVSVRVERLQEISEAEARWEGVFAPMRYVGAYRDAFKLTWDSINASRGHSWDSNPWVWVVGFKRVEGVHGE